MLSLIAASLLTQAAPLPCPVELIVLGAGQDAGAPQIGNNDDPAWDDPEKRLLATSIAIVDREAGERYLFEATPDITEQLQMLDALAPDADHERLGLDGIFLTHAHMGHYTGLAFLGFESANAKGVPVYAAPRMVEYLRTNGPWSQLVEFENIKLRTAETSESGGFLNIEVTGNLTVVPWRAPHRDEFSETVGYTIVTGGRAIFFLPDVDSLEQLAADSGLTFEDIVKLHDFTFIDSTFFDDDELDRDMSAIPHPRTKAVMEMLAHLPSSDRASVHFIHYNHSNPIRSPDSAESKMVEQAGFNVARRGDRHCLKQ